MGALLHLRRACAFWWGTPCAPKGREAVAGGGAQRSPRDRRSHLNPPPPAPTGRRRKTHMLNRHRLTRKPRQESSLRPFRAHGLSVGGGFQGFRFAPPLATCLCPRCGQAVVEDGGIGIMVAAGSRGFAPLHPWLPACARVAGTSRSWTFVEGRSPACGHVSFPYPFRLNVIRALAPPPGRFFSVRVPPWSSTIRRAMAKPRPVPLARPE